ncbi:DUF4350 domain-containing protein [Chitinophaga flava]|uniref:DUF4350 domain-containing protein n=1 Tax=Chitinophaga flava TaxID=2259036 RepID=A0A365XZX9_9BACT|nr:DUF4350 domain-containing protein [Chitinophaga flava]RBL91628.1 hypothetical protein DF182_03155 [Chitinophaga flava]
MKRFFLSVLSCVAAFTATAQQAHKGMTVTLDYHYNYEHKKDKEGQMVRWHYIWDEEDQSGLSVWGHIFDSLGISRDTLHDEPTAANLRNSDIYMIIDPDTERESPNPHYMTPAAAQTIYNWVKAGGVLVLLENDSLNAEFDHFNRLSEKFGIHFNGDSRNRVQGRNWEQGAFVLPQDHEIFAGVGKVYIKELSTMTIKAPARAVFKDGDHVIMAVAKVGKGTVFAVGDPWFYNEYVDGKRLPAEYRNYQAAAALTAWLKKQVPARR